MAMDTSALSPVVRAAFEAWQAGDLDGWLAHFVPGATLTDDGNPRDFMAFSREIGKERFTSIEDTKRDGTEIVGQFHSDQWGDFRTYFWFHPGADGKITRLDIGQAG